MDFTLEKYTNLLRSLIGAGFSFQTFEDFIESPLPKVIVLRHDVDLLPLNSFRIAQIEKRFGISGSYYFRIVKDSYNPEVIRQIAEMGHEIGYHYETMDTCKGNVDKAYDEFCRNLEIFRKLYPVKTICMHGSPRSAFDNRDIWEKYDYRQLGIIGEPYLDLDFDKFFYLTDTGRCWNGFKFSVRDKMPQQENWIKEGFVFKYTNDIIKAAQQDRLPHQIMITIHPQRWTNNPLQWTKELTLQKVKNLVKRFVILRKE
jgi:hypothetical protein